MTRHKEQNRMSVAPPVQENTNASKLSLLNTLNFISQVHRLKFKIIGTDEIRIEKTGEVFKSGSLENSIASLLLKYPL